MKLLFSLFVIFFITQLTVADDSVEELAGQRVIAEIVLQERPQVFAPLAPPPFNDFGAPCKVDTQCTLNLACYVRGDGATFKCAKVIDQRCKSDKDCVNNLQCTDGKCSCGKATYYDQIRNDCVSKQAWGQNCTSSSQCVKGTICSTIPPLTNICLSDLGFPCNDFNGCANTMSCSFGKCGCTAPFETYYKRDDNKWNGDNNRWNGDNNRWNGDNNNRWNNNGGDSSQQWLQWKEGEQNLPSGTCALVPVGLKEFSRCKSNDDCKNPILGCDNQADGSQSNKCLRGEHTFCNVFSDCANGLNCIESTCQCNPGYYYDSNAVDCFAQKQYKEPCVGDVQCYGNTNSFTGELACDNRVQFPNPKDGVRGSVSNTCLKTLNSECKRDGDCANSMRCLNKKCGCPTGFYYLVGYSDCSPLDTFEQPCDSNSECAPGLACDNLAGGFQTNTCTLIPSSSSTCSSDFDCVNNAYCKFGVCSCQDGFKYDFSAAVCRPNKWIGWNWIQNRNPFNDDGKHGNNGFFGQPVEFIDVDVVDVDIEDK